MSDADEVFDSDAVDEFSEPEELDFDISDFVLEDDDELNGVLFELKVKEFLLHLNLNLRFII